MTDSGRSPAHWRSGTRQILRGGHPLAQLLRYGVVGGGSTVLQSVLYALLHTPLGVQGANVLAWAVCTVLATVGHRLVTFGVPRHDHRDYLVGFATSLVALGATAGSLALVGPRDGLVGGLVVFGVLTVIGCVRFVVLRRWFIRRSSD